MRLKRKIFYSCLILIIVFLLNLNKLAPYPVQNLSVIQPNHGAILTPEKFRRPLDSTLLTFPEWYLVFSPDEYAHFTQHHFSNQFPFFAEIWQYWNAYSKANQVAQPLHVGNIRDQIMLMVIGTSTTAEYFLRGLYEKTIGTLSADVSGRVEEDDYAANVATQYVNFINVEPWYEFDFFGSLKGLWLDNHFFGHGFFRKMERKYILTTEYLIKALYGQLIGLATHSTYGVASVKTAVLVKALPPGFKSIPQVAIINRDLGGQALLTVPRLTAFVKYSTWLAQQHIQFSEIAGNNAFITLSIIVPDNWYNTCNSCTVLFKQRILTRPGTTRVMIATPVDKLGAALNAYRASYVKIEHVYDY